MKSKKYILPIILIILSHVLHSQTGFVNNGMKINIESGAYINVVDFSNNTVGGIDGTIDIDGSLIVNGDMTNKSNGNLFVNIEPVPDGNIILGGADQTIGGTTPIFFENLKVINSTKTDSLNNCEVKGIFDVDGVLDLNQNRLILDKGDPGAINYQSGFVKSETTSQNGLGEIEWKIGSTIGTYAVPFGSGAGGNDLNLVLETKTAADPTGSIVFATYPTNGNNEPYPAGISSLDTFKAATIADRYWEIAPKYTTKQDVEIRFKYTPDDVDQTDNPHMIETNLEAIRYNDVQNTWLDMKMTGTCDVAGKIVTTPVITGTNYYTWWALSEFELRIPNAFIPEGDNKANALFMKGYDLEIYNRWNQVLYKGKEGWNGKYNGKTVSAGTYFYTLTIPDYDNQMKTIKGIITLVTPQ